jgi:hypothetical protein
MRLLVVVAVVAVSVASASFKFRSGSAVSEKKDVLVGPVRSWFCASLMLSRMIGSIVLVQATRSDVLA